MSENKIIERTTLINASTAVVWETLTDPSYMKKWLFDTEVEVISDWKVGSPIIFRGKFHGRKFEDHGIIQKFEPEKLFQYTYWSWISNLPDLPENNIITAFKLISEKNNTLIQLTQSNFVAKASFEHWNFYWNVTLQIIKKIAEDH